MDESESLLDTIFEEENVEDVEMLDAEEGELVGESQTCDSRLHSSGDVDIVTQESQSKKRRRRSKKNKRKKGGTSESNVTDINRFVLDTCRRLKERKSYLVWTAVGCLGVSALSDLVKEVGAIQACGGQKTADGRRYKTGGGILWRILKARDPNAFREIMKKGKEFEKQFRPPDMKKVPMLNRPTSSEAETCSPQLEPIQDEQLNNQDVQKQERSVHERIRVPVSYDDLVEVDDAKKGSS